MSQSVYIVKASKSWDYESSESSIVLTTLDMDEAIEFALDYYNRNYVLVHKEQQWDHFNVTVISTILGEKNTEALIWNSYSNKYTHNHYNDNEHNISYAYDLESALINKFRVNIDRNLKSNSTIRPTIGWALGKSGLLISQQDKSMEIFEYAIDQYSDHLQSIKSSKIINMASSILTNELIEQDAESKENKQMWSLYQQFEQEFHKV
jgi:hypothetical protein